MSAQYVLLVETDSARLLTLGLLSLSMEDPSTKTYSMELFTYTVGGNAVATGVEDRSQMSLIISCRFLTEAPQKVSGFSKQLKPD